MFFFNFWDNISPSFCYICSLFSVFSLSAHPSNLGISQTRLAFALSLATVAPEFSVMYFRWATSGVSRWLNTGHLEPWMSYNHNDQSCMDGQMFQGSQRETGSGYLSELWVSLNLSQERCTVCHQEERASSKRAAKGKVSCLGDGES